jgi:hypothetical protein
MGQLREIGVLGWQLGRSEMIWYCDSAMELERRCGNWAFVMHLPEFTSVGTLGFASWTRVQHSSESGEVHQLRSMLATHTAASTARAQAEEHGLASAPTWNTVPLGCMPLLSLHPWRQGNDLKFRATRMHASEVCASLVPGRQPDHCEAADRRNYPTSVKWGVLNLGKFRCIQNTT